MSCVGGKVALPQNVTAPTATVLAEMKMPTLSSQPVRHECLPAQHDPITGYEKMRVE
jgi:hypothetical protein